MEPRCIWLTGLPGAGKTTLARALARRLAAAGGQAFVLDGDALRGGLCRDLGFSDADRAENVRRVAEVARLMLDAGVSAVVALVSPMNEHRRGEGAVSAARLHRGLRRCAERGVRETRSEGHVR